MGDTGKKIPKAQFSLNKLSILTPEQRIIHTSPPPASSSPSKAKDYFLKKFADVMKTKEEFSKDAALWPMTGP